MEILIILTSVIKLDTKGYSIGTMISPPPVKRLVSFRLIEILRIQNMIIRKEMPKKCRIK